MIQWAAVLSAFCLGGSLMSFRADRRIKALREEVALYEEELDRANHDIRMRDMKIEEARALRRHDTIVVMFRGVRR